MLLLKEDVSCLSIYERTSQATSYSIQEVHFTFCRLIHKQCITRDCCNLVHGTNYQWMNRQMVRLNSSFCKHEANQFCQFPLRVVSGQIQTISFWDVSYLRQDYIIILAVSLFFFRRAVSFCQRLTSAWLASKDWTYSCTESDARLAKVIEHESFFCLSYGLIDNIRRQLLFVLWDKRRERKEKYCYSRETLYPTFLALSFCKGVSCDMCTAFNTRAPRNRVTEKCHLFRHDLFSPGF